MTSNFKSLIAPITTIPMVQNGHRAVTGTARMVEGFDRLAWLYRAGHSVPLPPLRFRSATSVTEEDVALCDRLIQAFVFAEADAPPPEGMWGADVFQDRQRELFGALRSKDAGRLAQLMAAMFRSDFVLGMAAGSQGVGQSRLASRITRLFILGKFVSLAESQGAARIENPEQGGVGLAFASGVDALVTKTERATTMRLDFPEVGAAYGIELAGRLITHDMPDQVYGAIRLRDAVRTYLTTAAKPPRIVEIGGGYGGMAYWLLQLLEADYTIVDLPAVNVIQGFFLGSALGPDKVSFYGEPATGVSLMPAHAVDRIPPGFDVLANKDSLPEIPETDALNYLSWGRSACAGIFYSYNQEAAALSSGSPQNVVAELLNRVGGYTRLRRDSAWLRRGYAEEIYRIA